MERRFGILVLGLVLAVLATLALLFGALHAFVPLPLARVPLACKGSFRTRGGGALTGDTALSWVINAWGARTERVPFYVSYSSGRLESVPDSQTTLRQALAAAISLPLVYGRGVAEASPHKAGEGLGGHALQGSLGAYTGIFWDESSRALLGFELARAALVPGDLTTLLLSFSYVLRGSQIDTGDGPVTLAAAVRTDCGDASERVASVDGSLKFVVRPASVAKGSRAVETIGCTFQRGGGHGRLEITASLQEAVEVIPGAELASPRATCSVSYGGKPMLSHGKGLVMRSARGHSPQGRWERLLDDLSAVPPGLERVRACNILSPTEDACYLFRSPPARVKERFGTLRMDAGAKYAWRGPDHRLDKTSAWTLEASTKGPLAMPGGPLLVPSSLQLKRGSTSIQVSIDASRHAFASFVDITGNAVVVAVAHDRDGSAFPVLWRGFCSSEAYSTNLQAAQPPGFVAPFRVTHVWKVVFVVFACAALGVLAVWLAAREARSAPKDNS